MKLGYILLYVEHVSKTVEFYENAFGIKRLFVHESGTYGEMDTGGTKLGFVATDLAKNSVDFTPVTSQNQPPGIEVGFVTEKVDQAFEKAIQAGAVEALKPMTKPWGQRVAYVRDLNGFLVEICSPMGS